MSVLIKGYKMPETCINCAIQFGGICFASPPDADGMIAETVEEAAKQKKPDWCPLVEIEGDDVAPVVCGHWIEITTGVYQCSKCTQLVRTEDIVPYRFCNVCGAKMDKSEESKE